MRRRDVKDQAYPILHDIPIGIDGTGKGHETDSMGVIEVPADRYWVAQTQRSLCIFASTIAMPKRVYDACGDVKKAAALQSGYIDEKQFDEIVDPRKMIGDGIAES